MSRETSVETNMNDIEGSNLRYEVIIADHAEQDLRDIYQYIAIDCLAPDNADALLDRLEEHIYGLDLFPESHPLCEYEPWHSYGVRTLPAENFNIHYLPDDDALTVTVVRVLYGRRNVEKEIAKTIAP